MSNHNYASTMALGYANQGALPVDIAWTCFKTGWSFRFLAETKINRIDPSSGDAVMFGPWKEERSEKSTPQRPGKDNSGFTSSNRCLIPADVSDDDRYDMIGVLGTLVSPELVSRDGPDRDCDFVAACSWLAGEFALRHSGCLDKVPLTVEPGTIIRDQAVEKMVHADPSGNLLEDLCKEITYKGSLMNRENWRKMRPTPGDYERDYLGENRANHPLVVACRAREQILSFMQMGKFRSGKKFDWDEGAVAQALILYVARFLAGYNFHFPRVEETADLSGVAMHWLLLGSMSMPAPSMTPIYNNMSRLNYDVDRAYMDNDGTIFLRLTVPENGQTTLVYPVHHPEYTLVQQYVHPLKAGEEKIVEPWVMNDYKYDPAVIPERPKLDLWEEVRARISELEWQQGKDSKEMCLAEIQLASSS